MPPQQFINHQCRLSTAYSCITMTGLMRLTACRPSGLWVVIQLPRQTAHCSYTTVVGLMRLTARRPRNVAMINAASASHINYQRLATIMSDQSLVRDLLQVWLRRGLAHLALSPRRASRGRLPGGQQLGNERQLRRRLSKQTANQFNQKRANPSSDRLQHQDDWPQRNS